ncbi:MAG: GNAT family N-acetyltransferase [Rhizobiaceae bacterium]
MNPQFRSGLPSDAPDCVDILRDWVEETRWMPAPDERQELVVYWQGIFESDLAWVAEIGDHIVGFCTRSDELVGALYVIPEARSAGIGKHLLDLAKANRDWIALWAYEKNTPARKFYQREGLIEVSREIEEETNLMEIKHHWASSS